MEGDNGRRRRLKRRRIAAYCRRGHTVQQAVDYYDMHISHIYRCILEFAPKKRKRKR